MLMFDVYLGPVSIFQTVSQFSRDLVWKINTFILTLCDFIIFNSSSKHKQFFFSVHN